MENNDGTKNELKIELYPDRKPRYSFEKSPLRNIVPKDALETSFDKNKELAFISENVPMLNGFYTAHCNHYPIRIKPDDIWILIVQAFSHHVNINSEELRDMFVNFSGKKELIIQYPLSDISQVNKKVLENFSEQINTKMKEFLGEELLNILTPNYSTTDYDSLIVCKISIMGAFKKYFDYTLDMVGCGIPYLILEGTADDYEKIKSKAKYLSKYKFEWYINKIIPHIDKMIEAKKEKSMLIILKILFKIEKKQNMSLIYLERVDHLSGWFLNFFAYWTYGDGDYEQFTKDHLGVKDFEKLPSQMLIVPFKIVDEMKGETYEMKYKVGFIGCDKNEKNEVSAVTGWIVSPSSKEDRESIL